MHTIPWVDTLDIGQYIDRHTSGATGEGRGLALQNCTRYGGVERNEMKPL